MISLSLSLFKRAGDGIIKRISLSLSFPERVVLLKKQKKEKKNLAALLDFNLDFGLINSLKRLYLLTHKRTHPLSLFLFLSLSSSLSFIYI
jgi:hypothetical protein